MIKYINKSLQIPIVNNLKLKYKTWERIYELKQIIKYLNINKQTNNYYFNIPLNNQKTRSRRPKRYIKKWKLLTYFLVLKMHKLPKVKISNNFLLFDYINRLWYKQWYVEWEEIKNKRLTTKLITYKNKNNINFPILQYKHIIRNFKVVNKKKQKFLTQFNLGFLFFEYFFEQIKTKNFNKKLVKKKYGRFFTLKSRKQNFKNKNN